MSLPDLLSPRRVSLTLAPTSKKRLLESLAALLAEDGSGVDPHAAFQCLIERERLGSTGIGEGVALPHGRMKGLARPVGAFARLASAMDYEAIDRKPVRLVFALLVPEAATEEHLKILAELAGTFSQKPLRERLLQARNAEEIYTCLTEKRAA